MGRDCKYCGAYISDMVDVCPSCGKKVKNAKPDEADEYTAYKTAAAAAQYESREEAETEQKQEQTNGTYTYKDEFEYRYGAKTGSDGNYTVYDAEVGSGDDDVRKNKGICILCYLGLLLLIPYLTRRDSEFVKFHCNQGLLLFIVGVIGSICGSVFGFAEALVTIFEIICFFKGVKSVCEGKMEKLPLIGDIQILK